VSQPRQISPLAKSRTAAVLGSVVAALLAAGCGSSSGGGSTQASSASSVAQATTSTSGAPSSTVATAVASRFAAGVVTGSSGAVTATLHAGTHHPKVDQAWPLSFTVSAAGRPAKASVSYEYLFGGQVVAHRGRAKS
jgi:hypothetical protein